MSQIEIIKQKLRLLQDAGRVPANFQPRADGRYFNPPLEEAQLLAFEQRFQVLLPASYRDFLREIGNGGLGPYSGLSSLESSPRPWELVQDPLWLARPFPLTIDLWVLEPDPEYGLVEGEDYVLASESEPLSHYSQGTLDICHFGCGIVFLLVVTGAARGSIWVDDRANDKGIFALNNNMEWQMPLDFLAWYENWLDTLLSEPGDDEEYYGYFEYALRPRR